MKRTSPLLLVAVLLSAPATALPIIDVSLSAGLNHSRVDSIANEWDGALPASYSGTNPRAAINISLTSILGFELGWSKLASDTGTVSPPLACPGSCPPGTVDPTFLYAESGSAFWLAYAPSIRFSAFELTGKIGAARIWHEFSLDGNTVVDLGDTEVIVGAAGTFWFADAMGVRVDAERVGDDVAQIGLSLTIGF